MTNLFNNAPNSTTVCIESLFVDELPCDEDRVYRVTDKNGFGSKIPTDMKVVTNQSKRAYRVYHNFVSNADRYNYLYIVLKGEQLKLTPLASGEYSIKLQKIR
jgi:hypothetical protein